PASAATSPHEFISLIRTMLASACRGSSVAISAVVGDGTMIHLPALLAVLSGGVADDPRGRRPCLHSTRGWWPGPPTPPPVARTLPLTVAARAHVVAC